MLETSYTERTLEDLHHELLEKFPEHIWRNNGELIIPPGKNYYSSSEKDFFRRLLEYKITSTTNTINILKGADKTPNSDAPEPVKPFVDSQESKEVNGQLYKKMSDYLLSLQIALQRVKSGNYGKSKNGIIHPYRLWLVPHTTMNINEKNRIA